MRLIGILSIYGVPNVPSVDRFGVPWELLGCLLEFLGDSAGKVTPMGVTLGRLGMPHRNVKRNGATYMMTTDDY